MRSLLVGILLTVVALAILGSATVANAERARAWDNEDFHVDVAAANDFHIRYFNNEPGRPMILKNHIDDAFTGFTALPNGDSTSWDCSWSGHPGLLFCDTIHVGVEFEMDTRNRILKDDIYWTLDGVPVPGGDTGGPGFDVSPPEGFTAQLTYSFFNSTSINIVLRNVEFRFSGTETALADMTYDAVGPGWSSVGDITINAGASADVVITPGLSPPYYVNAQGEVEIEGSIEGHFVHQHEHPPFIDIPTLSQWGLIVLLLLLVVAGTLVYRRKRALA